MSLTQSLFDGARRHSVSRLRRALCAFCAVTLLAGPANAATPRTIAVAPIEAYDVDAATTAVIEQVVLTAIDALPGHQSISSADVINNMLQAGAPWHPCQREVACLAKAGAAARAHSLIEAKLSGLGGALSFALRLVDVETAKVVGAVQQVLPDNAAARDPELNAMVRKLLVPETFTGTLSVFSAAPGVQVYLDERLLGTTPLPGPVTARAGLHILRFARTGHQDINRFVEVGYQQAVTAAVTFEDTTATITISVAPWVAGPGAAPLPEPTSSTQAPPSTAHTWRWYGGLGAGVVGIAGLTAAVLYGNGVRGSTRDRQSLQQFMASRPLTPQEYVATAARLDQINREGASAEKKQWVCLGVGAALLAGGAGLWIWDKHASASPGGVALVPVFDGDFQGLVAMARWP